MYCIKCGKKSKLYENLCESCFLERNNYFKVPKVIKIKICNLCLARFKSKHWEEVASDREAIIDEINDQIRFHDGFKNPNVNIELTPYKTNNVKAKINLNAKIDDLEINGYLETDVRINYTTCSRCSRISGSYFEAIIQVRAANRSLEDNEHKKVKEIVEHHLTTSKKTKENAFLTKIEYLHGGVDFYLGSATIAKQISKKLIKEFSGKLKESSTLVGRKEGRDINRVTFSVRISEYKLGDFIEINNQIYQVQKLLQKHAICINLKTGQKSKLDQRNLVNATTLGGKELIFEAVVIIESEKEVQVLDPENFKTIDLVKPKEFKVKSETVKIFKNEEQIFLLPNLN